MLLTTLAVRRNSPSRGLPSESSIMDCERSPCATAPITRAVSRVGWTRSSMRAFTETMHPSQEPVMPEAVALRDLPFRPHHPAQALELGGEPLVHFHHVVEGVGDFARHARPAQGEADREVTLREGLQCGQEGYVVDLVGGRGRQNGDLLASHRGAESYLVDLVGRRRRQNGHLLAFPRGEEGYVVVLVMGRRWKNRHLWGPSRGRETRTVRGAE